MLLDPLESVLHGRVMQEHLLGRLAQGHRREVALEQVEVTDGRPVASRPATRTTSGYRARSSVGISASRCRTPSSSKWVTGVASAMTGRKQQCLRRLAPRRVQRRCRSRCARPDLDVDAEARHVRGRLTEDLVDRPACFDDDRRGPADDARSGAESGLLEAPGERLRECLGAYVAAGLRPRSECHQLAARPEAGPLDGLGGGLVAHGGREELLERGVVEPAPCRSLVPEAHAVDRGGGRQPLHHQLVDRAPGLFALVQPARPDPSAGVIDARGDDFGAADIDDPRLAAAKAGRRQRRDDASVVAGRLGDAPRERRASRRRAVRSARRGRTARRPVSATAVSTSCSRVARSATSWSNSSMTLEPLGDLTPGPPLLPDDRSHVATVAGIRRHDSTTVGRMRHGCGTTMQASQVEAVPSEARGNDQRRRGPSWGQPDDDVAGA